MEAFSFAAGPCVLPPSVKETVARDVGEWGRSGLSALELPFTGQDFGAILAAAENDLRTLLNLPAEYRVLFIQGGATAQFTLLPMSLMGEGGYCEYVQSGYWSSRAIDDAARCWDVRVVATRTGTCLPDPATWQVSGDAAYCHFTTNESADGLQFHGYPDLEQTPLVADMTGDFLTRPLPIERFGLIYASAQKTLCATGLTIVIVRQDLLERGCRAVPAPFDLSLQAKAASKLNTPPTFSVLVAARMLRWLVESGGLEASAEQIRRRSDRLYDVIDRSGFYHCPVERADRSAVNVCFRLPDSRLDDAFVFEAGANGLHHLRGHAKVGGLRASVYASTPEEAVDALIDFMVRFRQRRG